METHRSVPHTFRLNPQASSPIIDISPDLYLRLLKRCLTRDDFPDQRIDQNLVHRYAFDRGARAEGRDWPTEAETIVGLRRPDWFRDTLPSCPVQRIAVLRLDGYMYESTHLALSCLYPKLSPGGFMISTTTVHSRIVVPPLMSFDRSDTSRSL